MTQYEQYPLFNLTPRELDTDTVIRRMMYSTDPMERKAMGAEYDRRRTADFVD